LTDVMIMAGGTGGHVFPGLAVAQYLRDQGASVVWMGTAKGIESRVVPAAGFDLELIPIQGLRGKGVMGWVLLPMRVLSAMIQALKILLRRKPSVVLALGGFVAGPGALVAWLLRKPLVVHEQNAIPGLTNRLLSMIARRVLCGFPDAFSGTPGSRHVGNPVRQDIAAIQPPEQRMASHSGALHLLVIGGSQGASALNRILPKALAGIAPDQCPDVWHQCGPRWLDEARSAYSQSAANIRVTAFIDDMKAAYEWADVVLCRAGAMTIAELSAAGVASILVPFPFAADDHQTANAEFLATRNAAILVPEPDLTVQRMQELLMELSAHRDVVLNMAVNARACAIPDATETVAQVCLELANA